MLQLNFRIAIFIAVSAIFISETSGAVIHRAKLVRVVRENTENVRTLADGTRFEKYQEKGDELPPLPIEEEESEDLSDLGKKGEIKVPVDENGKVVKGFEFLMKPITIDLDIDEKDIEGAVPEGDRYENFQDGKNGQNDYKPYENKQDISPKSEFIEETAGEEYDDVVSEPKEPVPEVPDLPKPDYTDSGESDEDVKVGEEDKEDDGEDENKKEKLEEVIVPSGIIENPILFNDEIKKKETETSEDVENSENAEDEDPKSVVVPNNEIEKVAEEDDVADVEEVQDSDVDDDDNQNQNEEKENSSSEEEELSDEDVEKLAEDLQKTVYENIMNKAGEFADSDTDSDSNSNSDTNTGIISNSDLVGVDENSIIVPQPPSEPELPSEKIVKAEDLDGVVLPDQEVLSSDISNEVAAEMAAESLKPIEPVVPVITSRVGPKIGEGVRPDSAAKFNVALQICTVLLAFLLF